jgi:hypothetical protein
MAAQAARALRYRKNFAVHFNPQPGKSETRRPIPPAPAAPLGVESGAIFKGGTSNDLRVIFSK